MEDIFDKIQAITGITKLSNSEVITPKNIVKDMADLLPANIFNPDAKFLDPAVKSGRFLIELYHRLMNSKLMIQAFPDEQSRGQYILDNQLYGIATSSLAAVITRKALYNDPYKTGKIAYVEKYLSLVANKETNFQKLVKEALGQMKFDVIIGNPPYNNGRKDIFNEFMVKAKALVPNFISFIVPSKYFTDERDDFDIIRAQYLNNHMQFIVDWPDWTTIPFYNKETGSPIIGGGVHYFLYNKYHDGICKITSILGDNIHKWETCFNGNPYFIRFDAIKSFVENLNGKTLKDYVFGNNVFGLPSNTDGSVIPVDNCTIYVKDKDIYVSTYDILKNHNLINKYKVVIGYRAPGNNTLSKGKFQVITINGVLVPNEVCTQNYTVVAAFDDENMAKNCISYLKTKFVRMLIEVTLMNGSLSAQNFRFVPIQDFSHPWTDEMLYEKYGLTQTEINYIESIIKPMD